MSLTFRKAQRAEAARIAALVNSGYRGAGSRAGWTTEADYLVGRRTDPEEVTALIDDPDSIVLLCFHEDQLLGSMHLKRAPDAVYLGMFVVQPTQQGRGTGRQFLAAAESLVKSEWGASCVRMLVISLRAELIAYYERRGYRRTGLRRPFPVEDKRSTALIEHLEFEVLEKRL